MGSNSTISRKKPIERLEIYQSFYFYEYSIFSQHTGRGVWGERVRAGPQS